jgi:hypothetical protein
LDGEQLSKLPGGLKDQMEFEGEGDDAQKAYLKMSALGTVLQQCDVKDAYACTLRRFEGWEELCFGFIGSRGKVCLSPACTVASHQKGAKFEPQAGTFYLEINHGQLILEPHFEEDEVRASALFETFCGDRLLPLGWLQVKNLIASELPVEIEEERKLQHKAARKTVSLAGQAPTHTPAKHYNFTHYYWRGM